MEASGLNSGEIHKQRPDLFCFYHAGSYTSLEILYQLIMFNKD